MTIVQSATTWKRFLLGYWLVVPISFYLYTFLMTMQEQITMQDLLFQVPGMTLGFLITCLMLFQAVILFFLGNLSESKTGLLGKYLWFTIIQQILTGSLIGAVLAFFYERRLLAAKEAVSLQQKVLLISGMVFVGMISVFVLFLVWRMR